MGQFYARRGEIDKAISQISGDDYTPESIADLAQGALQSGKLGPEDTQKLIGVLQAQQAKRPLNLALNMVLGDLWSWISQPQEAANSYGLVLQVDPNYILL